MTDQEEALALLDDLVRMARARGASRIEVETPDYTIGVSVDPAETSARPPREAAAAPPASDRTQRVHAVSVGIFSAAREWTTGDTVERGAVLGAIQSLGHMAEITAPADGQIAEVLVAAGAPVEYGQPLFVIAPRS